MPELPEVETTRRGIEPYLKGKTIRKLIIRQAQLRWPIPGHLQKTMKGQVIESVTRRAKYILINLNRGSALIHLGMSGSIRVVGSGDPIRKHDHFDLISTENRIIRYHDPRRFGSLLWQDHPADEHPLLAKLGPEPLTDDFTAEALHKQSRTRRISIKVFIMDAHIVVGVGNIYASEALFRAGIRPTVQAGKVSLKRYRSLHGHIRDVLSEAIEQGGSSLNDFVQPDSKPGYFAQRLFVYGREGEDCLSCGQKIKRKVIGQRSTFYCPNCQV